MKVAFFEIEEWEKRIIRSKLPYDISFFEEKIDPENLPAEADFDVVSIFIDSKIDKAVLNYLPSLKFIATRSTGYDHIDLSSCNEKGIKVSFVPGYGDNTVAEYTFGLILNLTRKIYKAINQIKQKESFSLRDLRGVDLKGKTIGVIGVGRIGKEVIKIAKGFDMNIIAFSSHQDIELSKNLGFNYTSLEELLGLSDIITIHCPYNKFTHHLINRENINLVKKGSFFINSARGGIIETEALVYALEKGIFQGAALDVLEEEGELKDELHLLSKKRIHEEELKVILYDHILMNFPNVLITPHNAFNSKEAMERILNITIENIKSFIENKPINIAE